ncbi:sensor domain-containing diguanylate cyclase [Alteromonas lipolytica]|uniref:Diguanylate cyclase n=1 Tax=Alteromonas lipolytica TaxID=1856405 RepID=A0A1E8FEM2_9ALTE|nr:diguanylate cyclase [Alteromonas lipolytica]OFI34370.1 hypothetical protein BFC17_18490 [Alteromonas lipolytica]GGF82061.1 hypothetical protein GCM10011338_37890 [Alteromonas lipolytica]
MKKKALIEKYRLRNDEYDSILDQFIHSIAEMFDMPIAFLGVIEDNTQWFKAKFGIDITEIPLNDSLCKLVVDSNDTVYIEDTLNDERAIDKPTVTGPPHVRFYAGVPFKLQDTTVGSVCLVDTKPRVLSNNDIELLIKFSRHLAQCVELIYANLRTEDEHQLLNNSPAALIRWQARPTITTSYLSQNFSKLLRIDIPEDISQFQLENYIYSEDFDEFMFAMRNHHQGASFCECDFRIESKSHAPVWYKLVSRGIFDNNNLIAIQGLLFNNAEQKYLEQRILETNERMRLLLEASGLGTSDWDLQNDNMRVNNRMCDIVGMHPDSVDTSMMFWAQLVHPADKERLRDAIVDSLISPQTPLDIEYRVHSANRSYIWLETYGKVVTRDKNGRAVRFAMTHRDITEKKLSDLAVERQRRLLGFINHAQNLFVAQKDLQLACEQIFPELIDLAESEYGFIGKVQYENGAPLLHIYAISDVSWSEETKQQYELFKQGKLRFTNLNNLFGHVITSSSPVIANAPRNHLASKGTPKGHPVLHRFLGLPIKQSGETVGVIGLANKAEDYSQNDVTFLTPLTDTLANLFRAVEVEQARYEAEQRLEHLASTDSLTGLMNRRAYFNRIQSLTENDSNKHCVCIIDIDNFKKLNDTYGHPVGDQVLKEVARTLEHSVRNSDMVSRLGGEEFGLYLESGDVQQCSQLLDELMMNLTHVTVQTDKGVLDNITISIGASVVSRNMQSATTYFDQAMKEADDALYEAKRQGKNRYHWYQRMKEEKQANNDISSAVTH